MNLCAENKILLQAVESQQTNARSFRQPFVRIFIRINSEWRTAMLVSFACSTATASPLVWLDYTYIRERLYNDIRDIILLRWMAVCWHLWWRRRRRRINYMFNCDKFLYKLRVIFGTDKSALHRVLRHCNTSTRHIHLPLCIRNAQKKLQRKTHFNSHFGVDFPSVGHLCSFHCHDSIMHLSQCIAVASINEIFQRNRTVWKTHTLSSWLCVESKKNGN